MTNWISVKDRLPEELKDVIATDGKIVHEAHWYKHSYMEELDWYNWKFGYWKDVTHWMPLPQLPKP
jgi:hypothetical protein